LIFQILPNPNRSFVSNAHVDEKTSEVVFQTTCNPNSSSIQEPYPPPPPSNSIEKHQQAEQENVTVQK
jgi:hypothetical protein